MRPKNILLPTDFSPPSLAALERGFDMAKQFDGTPHFVHVVQLMDFTPMMSAHETTASFGDLYQQVVKRAEARLQEIATRLAGDQESSPTVSVIEANSISTALCDYAHANGIDLMVVGTHGHSGLKRFILGSVAERLVRLAPCPVMTIGPEVSIQPERPLRILGAVDLAHTTDEVIETVGNLASLYGAESYFLHVVRPVVFSTTYEAVALPQVDLQRLLEAGEEGLEKALHKHHLNESATSHVVCGAIADAIVAHAEEHEIDLIVAATHGRKGIPHVLLGSVADRVVRTAKCPVLVLRSADDAKTETTAA